VRHIFYLVTINLDTLEVVVYVSMNTSYWKQITVHPDGSKIFVTNNPDVEGVWPTIQVFDTSTGEMINDIGGLTAKPTWNGGLSALEVSPDGRYLFAVSQSNELTVMDIINFNKIRRMDIGRPQLHS